VDFLRDHSDAPAADAAEADRLAARARGLGRTGKQGERARLFGQAAELYRRADQLGPAVSSAREAVASSVRTGDRQLQAANQIRLATAQFYAGGHREAAALLEQSAELCTDIGDELMRSFALQHLGKCLVEMGRTTRGRSALTAAAIIRFELDQPHLLASSLRALLELERGLDDDDEDQPARRQHAVPSQ